MPRDHLHIRNYRPRQATVSISTYYLRRHGGRGGRHFAAVADRRRYDAGIGGGDFVRSTADGLPGRRLPITLFGNMRPFGVARDNAHRMPMTILTRLDLVRRAAARAMLGSASGGVSSRAWHALFCPAEVAYRFSTACPDLLRPLFRSFDDDFLPPAMCHRNCRVENAVLSLDDNRRDYYIDFGGSIAILSRIADVFTARSLLIIVAASGMPQTRCSHRASSAALRRTINAGRRCSMICRWA